MGMIWELDFYSRPLLDENEKKRWEVLICESPTDINTPKDSLFHYSQFCPSSTVNSLWLSTAIQAAIAEASQPPEKIRFFRRPMANMITKACNELSIPVAPSRRTSALSLWLDDRMENFYPTQPGYQPGTNPTVQFIGETPQPLPDALIGEKWAFVTLGLSGFADMKEWEIAFGESLGLSLFDLDPETPIPGLIIFSSRAMALAGWMSGVELAFWKYEPETQPRIILETGVSDRWILANLRDPQTQKEAQLFEEAKHKAKNLHFLAVQSNPPSESFAGFWLMQELSL